MQHAHGSYQLFISGHCTNTGGRVKGSHWAVTACICLAVNTCEHRYLPHKDSGYMGYSCGIVTSTITYYTLHIYLIINFRNHQYALSLLGNHENPDPKLIAYTTFQCLYIFHDTYRGKYIFIQRRNLHICMVSINQRRLDRYLRKYFSNGDNRPNPDDIMLT